jgi:diguanylate cyclase (GGDEF)-like protein
MADPAHISASETEAAAPNAQAATDTMLSILLVGQDGPDQQALRTHLNGPGAASCSVVAVADIADAARYVKDGRYDAVILDLGERPETGIAAVATLQEALSSTPILVCGSENEELAVKALALGAQDYLVKGTSDSKTLTRAIRFAMERKRTEQSIQVLANYDSLTQLPNRELLQDRMTQAIAQATRQQTLVGLLLLDLDRFKLVNDTLGHDFGDELLKEVASRVKSCIRASDTLSRLGGDEFVVILNGIETASDAAKVARKVIDTLSRPIVLNGHEVVVTGSIGISLFPNDGRERNALLSNADVAMYRAKEQGRNHFQFYTEGMNAATIERLTLENDLRHAVERDELVLHYQPLLELASGRITGVEALVRWQHPEQGMIPPIQFIPLAEETGLIASIGTWVLREACAQMKRWINDGADPMVVSVNLSSHQFHREDMLRTVTEALEQTGLDPSLLSLEITESSLMVNPDEAVVTLCLLHSMGVGISIDDFGTGYSSLGYLKRFPISTLKIDRSFINDLTENPEDSAIVRAVLAMAHSLSIGVVAEGVETEYQLEFLREAGCDIIQGYHLSKPLSPEDYAARFLTAPVAQ